MQTAADAQKQSKDLNTPVLLKSFSYLLKVGALKEGLTMTSDGFIRLDDIIEKTGVKSKGVTPAKIQELIDKPDNTQYEFKTQVDESGQAITFIRVRQPLSLENAGTEEIRKVENPAELPLCVHETYKDGLKYVRTEGLLSLQNLFEFRTSYPNNEDPNRLTDLFVEVNVQKAMEDGIEFFLTKENKIFSRGINGTFSPKYLVKAFVPIKDGKLLEMELFETKKKKAPGNEQQKNVQQEEEKKEIQIDNDPKLRGNHFKYLCVLDFEAQCSNDDKLKVQEIIELPVVIVDVERMAITETFHYYLKPVVHPILFPFCTELTGITQDKVDAGISLEEALEKLDKFLSEKGILNSSFCFVTCGDWDLNMCLRRESKAKTLPVKRYLKRWINIKKVYPLGPGDENKKFGMTGLLRMSNLELIGRHHSGIDDATNIARVVIYLLEKNFQFKSTMVAEASY